MKLAARHQALSRRSFVGLIGSVVSACGGVVRTNSWADRPFTVAGASRAIRRGELSAESLAQEVIDRVTGYPSLGAFVHFDAERLLAQARAADAALRRRDAPVGPLHGVPIALKDNIDTAALPTTGATPALAQHRPTQDAVVAQRLFSAGALLAGKTNMDELAGGGTTSNPLFGRTANPYAYAHIPGGSSGGSGAAVAARIVPAALGTDTAGSVRIPSAYCGIVGFRPSTGRVPVTGVIPFALTRDTVGPMATTVEDIRLLDAVLAGEEPPQATRGSLQDLRLGLPAEPYHRNLSPSVERIFFETVKLLEGHGVSFVQQDIPRLTEMNDAMTLLKTGIELHRDIGAYLEQSGLRLSVADVIDAIAEPFVREFFSLFRAPSAAMWAEYDTLMRDVLPSMRATYADYLREHRLEGVFYPTIPVTAGIHVPGTADVIVDGARLEGGVWLNIQNVSPTTLWACGGVALPAGLSRDGLPVSVSIDGRPNEDQRLLAVAQAVEAVLPKLPPPA